MAARKTMPSLAVRVRTATLVAASLLCVLARFAPAATGPTCPSDRFAVIARSAVALIGRTSQAEIVVVQGLTTAAPQISITSGCTPVRARIKKTKAGVSLEASWPKTGCAGERKVRAKVTISAGCNMSGVLNKANAKPVKFTAGPSACGDGVVDTGRGEECEPGLGCSGGGLCVGACRCQQPITVPTLPPRVSTTTSLPPSTTSTMLGGTSTTSTTLPASGTCGDAQAPVCDGTCAGGYVCADGVCIEPLEACVDNTDCASNYCFVDFGVCGGFASCASGDDCASGLCGTFNSCFCWYF
jgi:hypothetical protein